METTTFTNDNGIKGISIESEGRGADFYADGDFIAWDGNGMFSKCEATNRVKPLITRNKVIEAFAIAAAELNCSFDVSSFGVYVDEEGNVDPYNEI